MGGIEQLINMLIPCRSSLVALVAAQTHHNGSFFVISVVVSVMNKARFPLLEARGQLCLEALGFFAAEAGGQAGLQAFSLSNRVCCSLLRSSRPNSVVWCQIGKKKYIYIKRERKK